MRRLLGLLAALVTTMPLGAQDAAEDQARDATKRTPAQEAAEASNAFGAALYQRLAKKPGNLFFSPYSLSVALAMTEAGARGNTRTQMRQVLDAGELDLARTHAALRQSLAPRKLRDWTTPQGRKTPVHALQIANRVWIQSGMKVQDAFRRVQTHDFGAPLGELDFARTAMARKRINDWVAKATKNRIQDIVQPPLPTPDTRIALANAIHFQARWKEEFWDRNTVDLPFTTSSGKSEKVPTMHLHKSFAYTETDFAQVLSLPYRGGDTAMWIVLPKPDKSLEQCEERFDAARIRAWAAATKIHRVQLKLPKFHLESNFELSNMLKRMGMLDAFDPERADFTGIEDEHPLFLGAVLHKAFLKVDENGTEAAAATVVIGKLGAELTNTEPVTFVADHPFLFFIRHEKSGNVLFLGRVCDPSTR